MGSWSLRRPRRTVTNKNLKQKNSQKSFAKTSPSARLAALFLTLVFVGTGIVIPTTTSAVSLFKTSTKQPAGLAVAEQTETSPSGAIGEGTTLSGPEPGKKQTKKVSRELVEKRTANTETFDNGDGTGEVRNYMGRVHYKVEGKWQKIDNSLTEDANAADSNNPIGKAIAWIKGKTQDLDTYRVKSNDWQARFAVSDDKVGMVRIEADGKKIGFSPQKANRVTPQVKTMDGQQYVLYENLWNGVDVQYEVKNDALKEVIVVNKPKSQTSYDFKVSGAKLKANKDGSLTIVGSKQTFSALTVAAGKRGIISEPVVGQTVQGDVLRVSLDKAWFSRLKSTDFPVVIDPSWGRGTSTVSWNYVAYKSNGYVCSSSSCFMNAGYLNDGGWKGWRSVFQINFDVLRGKQLLDASMHLHKSARSFWTGTTEGLYTELSHANCWGYNCIDFGAPRHSAWFGTDGDINFTALMQSRMNIGDWGACFVLNGEERAYTTYKGWDADNSYFVLSYNSAPAMASPVTPADGQVVVTDQPLLQVNAVSDPDGDVPQYYYRVATGKDAESGSVINSGWLSNQTSFTIPEGRLQDGVTYYWHVYTTDSYWQTNPNWVKSFKYDARLGSDGAASFDDGGPVDVNLATGNVTTSASTHSTSALGGSIGLGLDYNSPYRSKPGLVGQYFNNTGRTGSPVLERVEPTLEFPWGTASPAPGVVSADAFSSRYTGYFVAPKTGTYQFGFWADDNYWLYLNNETTAASTSGCCAASNWTMVPRTFTEGQVIPIRLEMAEGGGAGYLHMRVRVNGVEQQIPSQWLRTAPRPTYDTAGLMGKYYNDDGTHVFPGDEFSSFLQRREKNLFFNWLSDTPVAYGPVDNFMARYTGYFTAPVSGNYQFGTGSDDGSRIFLNGSTSAYQSDWVDSSYNITYGGNVALTAGQTIPITAEFFEHVNGAAFGLYVKGAVAEQIIPSTWLSTKINPLPNGWQLSIDPDGDVSYDYASIQSQSVILYDAEGDQHEYKWTGTAYTPPVNEYGTLTRNGNGTLTLIDSDGTTYNFDSAGRITAITAPTDDRKPAALKYEYGGSPVRLQKITDGTDTGRYGNLLYSGDSNCPAVPSGYDTAPANMLCAFVTNDGRATNFVYKNDQLARLVASGEETTTLGYDDSCLARGTGTCRMLSSQQTATAYDAIKADIRQDNATVTSEVSYDLLGRAQDITMPAATEGGFRAKHKYTYLYNATQTNEVGENEPKGYSDRIEYDSLYRTIKDFDKSGLATLQEWDPIKDLLLSSTDAAGLKSTTIYNANDMPIDSYGPAPKAWFGETGQEQTPSISGRTTGVNDMFVVNASRQVEWRTLQNGAWSAWQNIGGCAVNKAMGSKVSSSTIIVTAQDCTDTTKLTYATYRNGVWSAWKQVPGSNVLNAAASASMDGNRVDLVTRGPAQDVVTVTYNFAADSWGAWSSLGGCLRGIPSLTTWAGNRLDIFAPGCSNSDITQLFQKTYMNNAWQANWVGFSDFQTKYGVGATAWANGRIDIVGVASDDQLLFKTFANGQWYAAYKLGGCISDQPFIGSWGTDRLDISVLGCGNSSLKTHYVKTWQTSSWTDYVGFQPSDRKPLAAYAAQVPHMSTGYDEGISGLSLTHYGTKTLTGAPTMHSTAFNNAPNASVGYTATAGPTTPRTASYSYTATGKITLGAIGNYTFRVWHDDGVRVYIDDNQILNAWADGVDRNDTTTAYNNTAANSVHRFRIDYYHTDNSAAQNSIVQLFMTAPGVAETANVSSVLSPDYGLGTSQTVYGAATTNGQTATLKSTTNYGNNPGYGLVQSASVDAGGLNLTATSSYEVPGQGYLRQTSSSLPGGATTAYSYYGPTDVVTNPCDSGQNFRQGGMLRLKTEPDPDGATGPQTGRTIETVYDDAGKVVATRYNQDNWTCTVYDARERVLSTTVPGDGTKPGRTIVNNYAVNGNPLVTSSGDSSGTITVETDLLGRNVKYTDARGNVTTSEYDNAGHLTKSTSGVGVETYTYDDYDRLTDQKLDGVLFAHINYDAFSRITDVTYPNGQKLTILRESDTTALGRVTGRTYTLANGQTLSDQVTRATTGDIVSGTELGQAKNYSYDTAGRLTGATVAGNTFTYGYGTQDSSCAGLPGVATDLSLAGKDSNRTTQTVNGAATNFCYDQADRLVGTSNALYDVPVYDAHGNATRMGVGTTTTAFTYDSSDRNVGIVETKQTTNPDTLVTDTTVNTTTYSRDVQSRLASRHHDVATNDVADPSPSDDYYAYTASGDSPDYVTNEQGAVTEKYLTLPGDVLVTIRPNRTSAGVQTFSLPNIHGDTMATVNADGSLVGLHMTGPFGEQLATQPQVLGTSTSTPWNTLNGASFGYVGQHEKLSESSMALAPIQMGARVYIPGLGRFLSVDPAQGGTPNNYVYPTDPVNDFDLTGEWGWKSFANVASWASIIPGPVGMAASAIAAAAYWKAGDKKAAALAVAGIAAAAVGAGIALKAGKIAKAASNGAKLLNKSSRIAKAGSKAETAKGSYSVYHGVDRAGTVRYVGITKRAPATRFAEHARNPEKAGLSFSVKHTGLGRQGARSLEQHYINKWGLQKNGGKLINKINSIRRR